MTYCDIGVNFVLLAIFTDEPAAELVDTRGHYLKPLMALGEEGLEGLDFLLKGVQASHLGLAARRTGLRVATVFAPGKTGCAENNTANKMTTRENGDPRLKYTEKLRAENRTETRATPRIRVRRLWRRWRHRRAPPTYESFS